MEAALSLPRSERRRIEKLAHRTKEAIVLVRCRIVLKVAMGCSRRQAGRDIGCVPSTAWQIVARFLKEGEASLVDRRCDNGDLKVDEDTREGIRQILQIVWRSAFTEADSRRTLRSRNSPELEGDPIELGVLLLVVVVRTSGSQRDIDFVEEGASPPVVGPAWALGREGRQCAPPLLALG